MGTKGSGLLWAVLQSLQGYYRAKRALWRKRRYLHLLPQKKEKKPQELYCHSPWTDADQREEKPAASRERTEQSNESTEQNNVQINTHEML